jgi:hypothetical protein
VVSISCWGRIKILVTDHKEFGIYHRFENRRAVGLSLAGALSKTKMFTLYKTKLLCEVDKAEIVAVVLGWHSHLNRLKW